MVSAYDTQDIAEELSPTQGLQQTTSCGGGQSGLSLATA